MICKHRACEYNIKCECFHLIFKKVYSNDLINYKKIRINSKKTSFLKGNDENFVYDSLRLAMILFSDEVGPLIPFFAILS